MDIAEQLRSHPLFASFDAASLDEIVRVATKVTYQPGQVCVRRNEAGEIFGVVLSGTLDVLGGSPDSPEPVGSVQAGECFGEMSLLTGEPSGVDVVAADTSQVVVFRQETIGPIMAMNREAVAFLTRMITFRLSPKRGKVASPQPRTISYALGAGAPMRVLSVSCRKDDLRYSFFDTASERAVLTGGVSGIGGEESCHTWRTHDCEQSESLVADTHKAALAAMLEVLTAESGMIDSPAALSVVGHRVCHGGLRFNGPVVIDEDVTAEIRRLGEIAPMENPFNLAGIEAFSQLAPSVPQVAVFDTAFHLTMPPAAHSYALPADLREHAQLRRFGGHGISHEGAARDACASIGVNFGAVKIVTCHLGSGASLTAIDHGRSVDNTMGFTPLEGLVMATRPGELDCGLVLHLIERMGVEPAKLREKLYTESGMLGLTGGANGDMIAIQTAADDGNIEAMAALEVFCHRARKYLAGYLGTLGGADAIVFTGGVGQNAPGLRARICQNLQWLGVVLDDHGNQTVRVEAGQCADISAEHSRVRVLVAGCNEQHTIARHAVETLSQQRVTDVIRRNRKPIPIGISAHHVHLSSRHVAALFGEGGSLTRLSDLTQTGQFACEERVNLIGPRGRIERVRVLGPTRSQTQVEISRTEEFKLGIDAPIRLSGDLDGTPPITLEGPAGKVDIPCGVVCAMRHVHMSPQDAMEFAVRDRDVLRINVPGERELIFGDVVVRINPDYRLEMHIDTDEANAAELSPGAVGYLDSIQERAGG